MGYGNQSQQYSNQGGPYQNQQQSYQPPHKIDNMEEEIANLTQMLKEFISSQTSFSNPSQKEKGRFLSQPQPNPKGIHIVEGGK